MPPVKITNQSGPVRHNTKQAKREHPQQVVTDNINVNNGHKSLLSAMQDLIKKVDEQGEEIKELKQTSNISVGGTTTSSEQFTKMSSAKQVIEAKNLICIWKTLLICHKSIKDYILNYLRLIAINALTNATEKDPLFVEEHSIVLSRNYFISIFKALLSYLGFVLSDYSVHSFRIGAATTCASNCIQDHMMQTLGRWKLNCFMRYIRTSYRDINSAQKMTCH
jgi:hypothetical protein